MSIQCLYTRSTSFTAMWIVVHSLLLGCCSLSVIGLTFTLLLVCCSLSVIGLMFTLCYWAVVHSVIGLTFTL